MRQRTMDLLGAGAFLALAGVMAWETFSEAYQSTGVGVAHDAVFYPRLVLGFMAVLALVLVWRTLWSGPGGREAGAYREPLPDVADADADAPARSPVAAMRWSRVWALVAASGAYAALMPVLGFFGATLVFVAMTPLVLGFRRWKTLVLVVLLFPPAAWLLFAEIIRIPLPVGILFGTG